MSIVNPPKDHHHAHHFDSAEQEYQTSKVGIWLFMVTEILMFGGLFVGFALFKNIYPEVFETGALFLDWHLGAANTIVLLTSSLTMALGIYYIQTGKREAAFWNLIATIACGAIFMVIKYFEYTHKFHMGLFPGGLFSFDPTSVAQLPAGLPEVLPANLALYFSFYFCMTGLHGIHVVSGMILIGWVAWRHKRGDFNPKYFTAVEGVGIFWHVVDLIWIYLFPLLYLV